MGYRLPRLRILDPVGADHIHADGARKTEVKTPRDFVFAPYGPAKFLNYFLELKGISVNCNFKLSDGVAAGEVADRVSGQKKDHSGFASCLAQLTQGVLLVGR